MKKNRLLLISTYKMGLKSWKKQGLYDREIGYYKKLGEYLGGFGIMTYDKEYEKPESEDYLYYYNKNKITDFLYSLFWPILNFKNIRNYDIVKTNQFAGAWVALVIKLIFNKKIFILRGGHAWDYEGGSKFVRYISDLVMNLCLIYADLIFFTSMEDREKYLRRINKKYLYKIKILPNAVDTNIFFPKINKTRSSIRIIMVGRLIEMKNFQSAISAISRLTNLKKEEFDVSIIGEGQYSYSLKSLASESSVKINFLGALPNSKIAEYLAVSDIFILPQFYGSGMSKVVLEAMACGNVVIASDLPAHRNTIDDGINGVFCKTGIESIQEKLEYVIQNINSDKIKKMRESAVSKVRDNFSMEAIIKKEFNYINEIYEKNI